MKVKRFIALDMRSALTQIRDEFGADAVILSSRNIQGGGVEVLAAYNEEDLAGTPLEASLLPQVRPVPEPSLNEIRQPAKAESEFAKVQRRAMEKADTSYSSSPYLSALKDQQFTVQSRDIRKSLASVGTGKTSAGSAPAANSVDAGRRADRYSAANASDAPSDADTHPGTDKAVVELRSELSSIRNLLEQRLSSLNWEQFARRTPVQALIWERLNNMGIPGFLSKSLLNQLPPDQGIEGAWRFAIAILSRSVPVFKEDIVAQGGVFALLGPTGAGKTTSIGKLASRWVLDNGPEDLALVTMDSYRVAAHEQLRAFGRILGVSVRLVDDKQNLQQTLASLSHKKLVLIDSAGLSMLASDMQRQFNELRTQPQVRKLLVLPCTSQGQVLRTVMKTWSGLDLAGCILTRTDEAASMGDALALAIDHKLAIAYEAFGQAIPDDLRVAQAHQLVSRAVALSKRAETDREQLMNDFANSYVPDAPFVGISGQRTA